MGPLLRIDILKERERAGGRDCRRRRGEAARRGRAMAGRLLSPTEVAAYDRDGWLNRRPNVI